MDYGRVCPEVAVRAAGEGANRRGTVRKFVQVSARVVVVAVAVTALNVGVAYAGEECSYESSSPPPSENNSSFSGPGDSNNSEGYSGGFGTYWSAQDQNDVSALLEVKGG